MNALNNHIKPKNDKIRAVKIGYYLKSHYFSIKLKVY